MASSARGKRRPRPLAPSLVVTVAATASLLACGGQVDANNAGSDGGPETNPAGCPSSQPAWGSACEGSISCDYPGCDPSLVVTYECQSGAWKETRFASCNPPGFVCPPTTPTLGTPCAPGSSCAYPDPCKDRPTTSDTSGDDHYMCDPATTTWKLAVDYVARCPDAPPSEGASCTCGVHRYPSTCTYPTGCSMGVGDTLASCSAGASAWTIAHATCNPPGPGPDGGPIDVGVSDVGGFESAPGDAGLPP